MKLEKNDMILINEFIRLGYTETDLVRLNRVRKHFKVIYMSDVTEGNGKKSKKIYIIELEIIPQPVNLFGEKKFRLQRITKYGD